MVSLISDIGKKRSLNEDYAGYLEKDTFKIYVVADGMGGHNAGEVASKMAVEGIIEYISKAFDKDDCKRVLKQAITNVNKEIYKLSNASERLNGMGTTVAACLETDNKVIIANVGDSSCFLFRERNMIKITKDHSLVQELIDLGTISEEEAFNHPKKNIITRAVGTGEEVLPDIYEFTKRKNDVVMLCSDGLTNEIQKNDVLDILYSADSIDNAALKLVERAKENGGRDNITVLLFGGDE